MNSIQIVSHEIERAWAGVTQAAVCLHEEIWEDRKKDWQVSKEVKEICVPILERPGEDN